MSPRLPHRRWIWLDLAAAVVLIVGLYLILRPAMQQPTVSKPEVVAAPPQVPALRVNDRYDVTFPPAQAAAMSARPLVSPEKYRSLYEEL